MYLLKKSIEIIKEEGILEYIRKSPKRIYTLILDCVCDLLGSVIVFFRDKIKGQGKFNLKNLNKGLEHSQKENNSIDDEDIMRIISAYACAKRDQCNQPKTYQIGGVWESLLKDYHHEFIMAYEKEDIERVRSMLSNFARDKISMGLSLFGGLPTTFFHKIKRVNLMNRNHYVWKMLVQLPDEV